MRSTGSIVLVVILLLVGFAGCAGCGTYNTLAEERNAVAEAWGNVETSYQRRADLIPNLVATVEGAADFEQTTFTQVTEARTRAQQANANISPADLNNPEALQAYLAAQQAVPLAINAVAEAYPQLRATEAFRDLQTQLEGTENRINTARTRYNEAVTSYNNRRDVFPAVLFAGIMGFDRRVPFEADEGADAAPKVDFGS